MPVKPKSKPEAKVKKPTRAKKRARGEKSHDVKKSRHVKASGTNEKPETTEEEEDGHRGKVLADSNSWDPLNQPPFYSLSENREPIGHEWPPYIHQQSDPWGYYGETRESDMGWMDMCVRMWIDQYTFGDQEELDGKLSQSQKKAIIDSLKGYCHPACTWEFLRDYLPPRGRLLMNKLLVTTFVMKEIYQTIITNPFFFLDVENDSTTGALDGISSPSNLCGTYLNQLYQGMILADWRTAHQWRFTMLRMLHGVTYNTTDYLPLGLYTTRLRHAALEKLVARILDDPDSVLHHLLVKQSDPERIHARRKTLVWALSPAIIIGAGLWITERAHYRFPLIESLGPFTGDCKLMERHWYTQIGDQEIEAEGGTLPKSRTPLLMTEPPLELVYFDRREPDGVEVIKPGVVMLEDPDNPLPV